VPSLRLQLAKDVLLKEGAKFGVVELDTRNDGDKIQAALTQMTGEGPPTAGHSHTIIAVHEVTDT
jgi:hypothetical protein